jgi:hypothetical protein
MHAFSNYVAAVRPQISIMESVRVAYTTGRPLMQELRANVERRTGLRYDLWHVFQNALELGGAAQRPRYFMVMSQVPFGVEYPRVHPVMLDRRASSRAPRCSRCCTRGCRGRSRTASARA